MSIGHVYSQTVADGTATSVVRPSDWNSVHYQNITIAGNTSGVSAASQNTNIVYQGGSNITLALSTAASAATMHVIGATVAVDTNKAGTGFTSTTTAGTAVAATLGTDGLSFAQPAFITTYANDLTSGRAGTGFTSTTTAGTAVVGTLNTDGLSLGVPAYLTVAAGGIAASISGNSTSAGAGYSNITSGTMILAGGNNITLSQNGASITISGANVGGAQTGISGVAASNTTYTSGTISFSNANGVSFGTGAGQAINITHDLQYTSATSAITSNAFPSANTTKFAGTGFTSTTTAGTAIVGTLTTNGLSVGVPAFITTYVNDLTSGRAGTGFTSTTTAGTAIVGTLNTNGLSIGVPTIITNALTTAAQSSVSNVSAAYAATNNTGGGTATLSGGISFTNANSATFYTSAGNAIALSFSTSQSNQTVASGNIAGTGFTSTTTAGTAIVGTLNTAGLSVGVPAFITTYVNDLTSGRAGTGFTSTTTAGTAVVGTLNTNGLSIGVPTIITNALTTAAQSSVSNVSAVYAATNNTGGGTVTLSGGVSFTNANNATFYTSAGNAIALSFSTSQSNQTVASGNIAGTGFTSTTTAGTAVVGTLNTAGLSIGVPTIITNALTTAAQSSVSNVSAVYAATNNTGGGTATLSGGVSFSNANNVTFYTSAGNAVAVSFSTSQSNQTANLYANGNTTQLSSTAGVDVRSLSFEGAGGASVGVSNGRVLVSVPVGGGGDGYNIVSMLSSTSGGGTAGVTFSTLSGSIGLMAGSNITLSQTSNTIVINGPSPSGGAGPAVGVSTGGNTSNTTGMYTNGSYVLVGGNNVTLSQVSGTGGATLTISVPSGGGIGVSTAGNTYGSTGAVSDRVVFFAGGGLQASQSTDSQSATVSFSPVPILNFPPAPTVLGSSSVVSGTSGAGSTTAALYVNPVYFAADVNAQELEMLVSNGVLSAGTGSATIGYFMGFYTLNAGTRLDSVSTFSAAAFISQNSATAQTIHTYWGSTSNANSTQTSGNISAAFMTAGIRGVRVYDSSFTMPAGTYYLVHGITQRSSSVNVAVSLNTVMYASGITNYAFLGQSTFGPSLANPYVGSVTSQITGAAGNTLSMSLPSTIHTSAITVSATNAGRWLIPRMYN